MFWIGVGKSERCQGGYAAWASGTWAEPYVTINGWTVAESLDAHTDGDVTADDWVELGRLFVERFKPAEVRRS